MKTALFVLACLCAFPYIMALISGHFRRKQLGKIDNENPREQYTKLQGVGARVVAAQQNSWEALGLYTAALVAVTASGAAVAHLAESAIIILIARTLHGIFYLTNLDKLRTLSFAVAAAACFYLLYSAIAAL
ncbi:MAG TPA: MAPEG family protein [Cellvibrionaceae bacterium]